MGRKTCQDCSVTLNARNTFIDYEQTPKTRRRFRPSPNKGSALPRRLLFLGGICNPLRHYDKTMDFAVDEMKRYRSALYKVQLDKTKLETKIWNVLITGTMTDKERLCLINKILRDERNDYTY